MSVVELERAGIAFKEKEKEKQDPENPKPSSSQGNGASSGSKDIQQHQEEYHTMVLLVLHLINLLCAVPKDAEREHAFRCTTHRLAKLNITNEKTGRSLLHLTCDKKTSSVVEEFYSHFPSARVLRTLIECGAAIDARDKDGNSPLHLCVTALLHLPESNRSEVDSMIKYLLENGAHADSTNSAGITATMGLQNIWPRFRQLDYQSLKCLSARVIKKYNIPFKGEIPVTLLPFMDMH